MEQAGLRQFYLTRKIPFIRWNIFYLIRGSRSWEIFSGFFHNRRFAPLGPIAQRGIVVLALVVEGLLGLLFHEHLKLRNMGSQYYIWSSSELSRSVVVTQLCHIHLHNYGIPTEKVVNILRKWWRFSFISIEIVNLFILKPTTLNNVLVAKCKTVVTPLLTPLNLRCPMLSH